MFKHELYLFICPKLRKHYRIFFKYTAKNAISF